MNENITELLFVKYKEVTEEEHKTIEKSNLTKICIHCQSIVKEYIYLSLITNHTYHKIECSNCGESEFIYKKED